MAYLLDIASHSYFPLKAHHTFGRLASSVDKLIDKPYISKLHAAIEWSGEAWRLKNLGMNGTWVNGVALSQGDSRPLFVNDVLHFADLADPAFHVIDITPPKDMLWPLNIEGKADWKPIYLSRYHLLPDSEHPEKAFYIDDQTQQWFIETIANQERQAIHAEDVVELSGCEWQFIPALICGPTEARSGQLKQVADIEFIFHLSLDEETTQLLLQYESKAIDLAVRAHHYLALQLARHRAADAQRGLDQSSQGWVYAEQLAQELGLDMTHVNIHIFRVRKQLVDALPSHLALQNIIERRGGRVRFGGEKFKIFKGDLLTTSLPLVDSLVSSVQ